MATADLFGRIGDLLEEIGEEKSANDKQAMDDPGGKDGKSSHHSATIGDDGDLPQPAPEGEMSADNTKEVKKQIPNSVDSEPEATPANAPTQDEVQLGQGVDAAKPTGEDPGTERDYKGTKEDPGSGSSEMGGTSHPAKGSFGEKYSTDQLTDMADDDLFKLAADLGNELLADVANGLFEPTKKAEETPATPGQSAATPAESADAGYKAAAAAGDATDVDQVAGQVITQIVKTAHHQADLIASYLSQEKAAMEGEEEEVDPTGGAGEGEDHGTEETEGGEGPTEAPPEEGSPLEGGAPGGGEEEALLAAMAGGGEGMGGEGPPMGDPGMGGPEMGGPPMGGPEMGGPPMGGPEMGGMGAPPEALGGMGDEEALQQLAMALMELGIDPAMLAQAGGPAPKLASAVTDYKKTGKFQVSETKTAAERQVRNYMKGYINELCKRSR
jgi:hypothetical protein